MNSGLTYSYIFVLDNGIKKVLMNMMNKVIYLSRYIESYHP